MKRIFLFVFILQATVLTAQDTTRLSLIFLGDIMQHDSQIADAFDARSGTYNYDPCFAHVKPYTAPADLAIANLELTLAGPPYKGYPQFSAPDQLLASLKNIGIDVMVTANNHCVDRGRKGLERTIEMLDSFNILHTGTFVDEVERLNLNPLLIEKNGFRIALLNYTYGTNGLPVYKPNIVNFLDTALMRKDLQRASALKPDVTIVFTHWGSEYQSLPSAWQRAVTKFCFDQGAQLVIGAHPHVVQPMEWNRMENTFVAYSLGNFVSGQRKRYTDGGAMVRIELEKVKLADNVFATGIDTVGYILQWVHRTADAEKNYFVYPVPSIEGRENKFDLEPGAIAALKTFTEDSRQLFRTHNENVSELSSGPFYNIEIEGTERDTLGIRQIIEQASDIRMLRDYNVPRVQIGPFTLPEAIHIQEKIRLVPSEIKRKDQDQ